MHTYDEHRSWFVHHSAQKKKVGEFFQAQETAVVEKLGDEEFSNPNNRGLRDNGGSEAAICLGGLREKESIYLLILR